MFTKNIGGNGNVVPTYNAYNLMDCNEIKRNGVTRSRHNKITHERQATFFGHLMRRVKPEHLETTGMIEAAGETVRKDIGWTNKVDYNRMSVRGTGREERWRWKVMMDYVKEHSA